MLRPEESFAPCSLSGLQHLSTLPRRDSPLHSFSQYKEKSNMCLPPEQPQYNSPNGFSRWCALSPAGAAVCLCGWGCVYRLKIPIDPRWEGSSLPLPFHVSATYFWVARNWKNQSPITAGWECWEMGWPSCLFVERLLSCLEGGDTADIGFTSAGFSWHMYDTLWLPVELKETTSKIKK